MMYLLFVLLAALTEKGQGDIHCVGLWREGECTLALQVGEGLWSGTFHQAKYNENLDCETHLAVWFNRAEALFRGKVWSTGAGYLCVPRVGSPWEWVGSLEWTTGMQAHQLEIRISTNDVTRDSFSGLSEVYVVFP